MTLLDSIRYLTPESVLVLEALVILIIAMTGGRRFVGFFALLGLFVSFMVLAQIRGADPSKRLFENIIILDRFAIFFKGFFIIATFFTVLFSLKYNESLQRPEYYAILLLSTVGMCLLASANDLLMAYIAIETVSISSYILTSFIKGDRKSGEAGLKYVIYGAIASGIMIYGMSLLYGLTGSTNFGDIKYALSNSMIDGNSPLFTVIILMILAGFGYKIAAVPFHMWCPDVYEGAPTPVTTFLSVAPKAAGFAILSRFIFTNIFQPSALVQWQIILAIICVFTMTIGNLGALKQTNLKRLLAYSSIAHCGYLLMGIVIFTRTGLDAVILYFVIYFFMNMGAFLVVIAVESKTGGTNIKDYRGLGWKMPLVGVIMAIFMFSLTGLPPLAGFIGKLYIFKAVIERAMSEQIWYWLAVVGALNSVISLYYYARVVKAMFLESLPAKDVAVWQAGLPDKEVNTTTKPTFRISPYYATLLVILVIPVLVLGVYWVPLLNLVKASLGF